MNFDRLFSGDAGAWMRETYVLVPNWKWLGLILAIFTGLLIKSLVAQAIAGIKNSSRFQGQAQGFFRYALLLEIQKPLAWVIACLFWIACIDSMDLHDSVEKYLTLFIQIVLTFNLIRFAYMLVDAVGKLLSEMTAKTETTMDDELVPFATKSLKVFVVIFGFLIAVQNFGVNVMSILAGLGLGGLALALAAQDTAANLFGSITILMDRPFKIGDVVRVIDVEGTIEEIGFRSTRIRTVYGSLVTIPNSTMAKEKIDNMGARRTHRIRHLIGLTYDTAPEKIQAFISQIENYLRSHPNVDQETMTVRFNAMNDFNLQILVNFFVNVSDVQQELDIQQKFLFEVMKIAKQLEVDFAFPTTTQYVKQLQP